MREFLLPDAIDQIDYEQLAYTELERASKSADPERRNAHLNQAAIFAALSERQRYELHPGHLVTSQDK